MTRTSYLLYIFLFEAFSHNAYGQKQIKFFRDDYKYIETMRSFYKIHTIHKTWDEAKRKCSMEGATLFYPENEFEAESVLGHLNETQPQYAWIFIGVAAKHSKGVFMSVDGIPIRNIYNNWGPGEPNDAKGEEDCVILRKEGTLNDDNCKKKYPFICKKNENDLKWNEDCNIPYLDYKYNDFLGRCYKFHLNPLNWRDAAAACDAEQSYLAIINTKAESEYLVNITAEAPKNSIQGSYLRGAVHLGFLYDESEGDWRATNGKTLEEAGFSNWGRYQPDGGEKERCGSMFYTGELNDISCVDQRCFFICEHENEIRSILSERYGNK